MEPLAFFLSGSHEVDIELNEIFLYPRTHCVRCY